MKKFNVEQNRIIYVKDNENLGEVRFIPELNNKININFVYVHPEYRGSGIASELMEYVYQYFKEHDKEMIATCPYAKKWLDKKLEKERI